MSEADYAAPSPVEIGQIDSIESAIKFVESVQRGSDLLHAFRGHADAAWNVVPSIFRDDMNVLEYEMEVIRDLISSYPQEFDNDRTMFDRLVRMQHFGLRTRLLDVTRNPLPALYFAVEDGKYEDIDGALIVLKVPNDRKKYYDSDAVSCCVNLGNLSLEEKTTIENTTASSIADLHKIQAVNRLFQFIRAEKPEFLPRIKKEDLFKPHYVVPKMNNRRIVAQNGAFIAFGLNRSKGPKYKTGISTTFARIPSKHKQKIRESLRQLGFDDSTLFPDIERSAKELMRRYTNE